MADVDAKLEGRRGHEHLELAFTQAMLRIEPCFLREAAVVRGDVLGAQALGELVRHAFRETARVHGDERRAVRFDERHEAVVDFLPHLVRHHGFQRGARHLHRDVHLAFVPAVHDFAIALREEPRHFLDRLLRR